MNWKDKHNHIEVKPVWSPWPKPVLPFFIFVRPPEISPLPDAYIILVTILKYFGTDGIRGKAYDFLNADLAYKVGLGLQALDCKEAIIGRDTRESGKFLEENLEKGAVASGINVYRAGIVSTPELSYLSKRKGIFGIMITGSHNPHHDNGIKIFKAGKKLSEAEEAVIEAVIEGTKAPEEGVPFGKAEDAEDCFSVYCEIFEEIIVPTDLRIGLDLANGATCSTAEKIFKKITPNVFVIGNNPDGFNINRDCGSMHPETIVEFVKEKGLDLGFAFDGDGDRILAVDSAGRVFNGDHLIYIFANYLKEKGMLAKEGVVLTKMSNLGTIKALKNLGIKVVLTDVGDKFVFEALEKHGFVLGGEFSGHIINLNLLETGDGVLNAVYLTKILAEKQERMEELVKEVEMYPEKTCNLRDVKKEVLRNEGFQKRLKEMQAELGEDGKIIVRPSGTEPVIRISVSAASEERVQTNLDEIVGLLRSIEEA